MSVLFVVLPLSLLIAAAGVWAFVWSVRGGQFDDLEGAPMRMLHDGGDLPSGIRQLEASEDDAVVVHPSALRARYEASQSAAPTQEPPVKGRGEI
ncbi:MAG: cbb3-type cytochrome oxidase assembly protein CcoS [Myxococcota bacterium]